MTISAPTVQPRLGLVCITASDRVRYRSLTRKRLLQFDRKQQEQMLRTLYTENIGRLQRAIAYCQEQRLHLYRLTSALFPFSDVEPGTAVLEEFADILRSIGTQATAQGLRLVIHPDQYVVLSSDDPRVIENAITILTNHARILDLLAQPRSPWAVMEIHGGKSDRAERLIRVIRNLPDPIRARLALENDEHCYRAIEIYQICQEAGVPMVFDAHHHIVAEQLDSYEDPSVADMLALARTTWPVPEWQLVHISNGAERFTDKQHSDLITVMPSAYRQVEWIEVEAKLKEYAIDRLRCEWLGESDRCLP